MYNKTLDNSGKQSVLFSLDFNVPLGFASDNIEDLGETKSLFSVGPVIKCFSLYLPTQICFPIGGKRVRCRGSKLYKSLGQTKLTNFQTTK